MRARVRTGPRIEETSRGWRGGGAFVEVPVNLIESPNKLIEPPVNLIYPPVNLIESPVHLAVNLISDTSHPLT